MSKTLLAQQIRLNIVDLIDNSVDPTAGGGIAAAIGSFYLRSGTGQAWLKTAASNTGWQRLVQSFAWYSVRDYGAAGDGSTDDTTAFQNAINDAATAGGGVVYVPHGNYVISQITINAQSGVQIVGTGEGSQLTWTYNAGNAAGSMLTIEGNAQHIKLSLLSFVGSGLTNPAAGRSNHLVAIGNGSATVEVQVMSCKFSGMVASSGDGVHINGGAVALVSRTWISSCIFDGCSRFSIGAEQDFEYVWIEGNYLTNCDTEIGFVSSVDRNGNAILMYGNEVRHTSGSIAQAVRFEGGATGLYTRVLVSENIIYQGFVTTTNCKNMVASGNVQTSGNYATTDAVWKIFGSVTSLAFTANLIDRTSGTSVGPCVSLLKSGGSPGQIRLGDNLLMNECVGGNFLTVVDVTQWSFGGNLCRSSDADVSVMYGVDVQSVAVNITDALIGPGNQFTAAAHSMAATVRLLCNGANVQDCSVVGSQSAECDYGLRMEVGGGGGSFTGQILYSGNNFDSSVGGVQQIGTAVALRIGFNAGAFGANYFQGSGTPEGVVTAAIGSWFSRSDGGQATAVYYKESGSGNTGWIGVSGTILPFGTGNVGTGTTAVFLAPGYISTAATTELQAALSRPGTVRNLRVQVATAGTGAATNTFTVRKNGADSAVTTTLANTSNGAAVDTTHSFVVAAGDLLSIDCTKSAGVAAGQTFLTATVELA